MELPAKMLKGDATAPLVPAHADERVPWRVAADVVAHPANARLYVPTDPSFACDAITVPPASAAASDPIVLWETSVTSPQDPDRVKKVCKWFRAAGTRSGDGKSVLPAGIIAELRAAHPGRPIVCALCWPETLLDAGNKHAYKELAKAAEGASSPGAPVRVAVVDLKGLQRLGVVA